MRDRELDRLFRRFRERGDSAALARVFDATAPELLGLAAHLALDVGEAEDLLQQTFLTAIEKAERYDADRRLTPWLVGILVRHAHAARRRRSRLRSQGEAEGEPGGEAVALSAPSPREVAEESELEDEVSLALGRLPATYRAVLEPYLLRGERAVDIARASGKAPGTVRVQIRRGLDELRRILPAGLAAGTSALAGGRSLAQVRATVIEAASTAGASSAALTTTSTVSTSFLGGLAVTTKLALGAAALTLLSLFGWWLASEAPMEVPALVEAEEVLVPDSSERELAATLPSAATPPETRAEEARVEVPTTPVDSIDAQLAAALAGMHGRVVDELGAPVVGVAVELLELRASMFEDPLDAPFDAPLTRRLKRLAWNPVVASATTDSEGRFELWGADPAGAHGIGIDLGGERPSLRVVDRGLSTGSRRDLGTIQLEPVRVLTGLVLDSDGLGVPGARVRAAKVPAEAHPLAAVRSDRRMLIDTGPGLGQVVAPPPALGPWIDRLPIPTTETDAEGRFELRGVAVGQVDVFVDHSDHEILVAPAPTGVDELEAVAFVAPREFSGQVVDAAGEPVEGAQVLFGGKSEEVTSGEGLCVVRGELASGADGGFRFRCGGAPMVAARRDATHEWEVAAVFQDGDELRLPALRTVDIELRDRAGDPVLGVALHVDRMRPLKSLERLGAVDASCGLTEELGNGEYRVAELPAGLYRLRALVPGFAVLDERLRVEEREVRVAFELDRSASRDLQVVDASTRDSIAGARVTIQLGGYGQRALHSARTDGEGRARLRGIPIEGDHDLRLRVAHPAYANAVLPFDAREADELVVELHTANRARFRVTVGGAMPLEPLAIALDPSEATGVDAIIPRLAVTDARGEASFEQLPAGEWRYQVSTRFFDTDVANLFSGVQPESLATGSFRLQAGATQVVDVELAPEFFAQSKPASTSGLEGHVRIDGVDGLRLRVALAEERTGQLVREWEELGVGGEYLFDGLEPVPHALLVIDGEIGTAGVAMLASDTVELRRDRLLRHDVDLSGFAVQVEVLDSTGEPVDDAQLVAFPEIDGYRGNPVARQGNSGAWELVLWEPGQYVLRAESPTAGLGVERLELSKSPGQRIELRLDPGVPCAGVVVLPEGEAPDYARLAVYKLDGSPTSTNVPLRLEGGLGHFEALGMTPGEYGGRLQLGDRDLRDLRFELPPGGDAGLRLECSEALAPTPLAMPAGGG